MPIQATEPEILQKQLNAICTDVHDALLSMKLPFEVQKQIIDDAIESIRMITFLEGVEKASSCLTLFFQNLFERHDLSNVLSQYLKDAAAELSKNGLKIDLQDTKSKFKRSP